MKRARNAVLLAAACLVSATASAQEWRGPASIALEVKGKPRGSVEGALVILRYQQMEPPGGPRPVLTDSAGRAVVLDLAPGVWEVEVSHEDIYARGRQGQKWANKALLRPAALAVRLLALGFIDHNGPGPVLWIRHGSSLQKRTLKSRALKAYTGNRRNSSRRPGDGF